jgi:hypothetical protein
MKTQAALKLEWAVLQNSWVAFEEQPLLQGHWKDLQKDLKSHNTVPDGSGSGSGTD